MNMSEDNSGENEEFVKKNYTALRLYDRRLLVVHHKHCEKCEMF